MIVAEAYAVCLERCAVFAEYNSHAVIIGNYVQIYWNLQRETGFGELPVPVEWTKANIDANNSF